MKILDMNKTNIETLVACRSKGNYGYTVRYRSGRSKTVATGNSLILPENLHKFMVFSPYSIAHDDVSSNYHEVIYYRTRI